MSLTTSLLTAGANSHQESSETANGLATDLISPGVIGVLTNTSGVAPATGGFSVNAQGSPDMTVAVAAGVAYVTATPASQGSQNLRVKNSASANVTISANASGSTRFDWLYIKVDATLAAAPDVNATTVATLVTSRSSSQTTDNGTPPTYGTLLAIVTVANGASSITNGNIADSRVRAVAVGGINDTNGNEVIKVSATASAINEVTVTNSATGNAPQIAATGGDTNIPLKLSGKGTSPIQMFVNGVDQMGAWQTYVPSYTNFTVGNATVAASYAQIGKTVFVKVDIILGSTSSVTGSMTVSLPVTSVALSGGGDKNVIGSGAADLPASATFPVIVGQATTTTVSLWVPNLTTDTRITNATATKPFTWATGASLSFSVNYQAA